MRLLNMILSCLLLSTVTCMAEDGSRLWLRYESNTKSEVTCNDRSASAKIAVDELRSYWKGKHIKLVLCKNRFECEGAYSVVSNQNYVVLRSSSSLGLLYGAYALLRIQQMGDESSQWAILKNGGSWRDVPRMRLRILNHWDNLDGSVERGYAGKSIWKWDEIKSKEKTDRWQSCVSLHMSNILFEYARANASIGINGAVLNNVNASPQILSSIYINKVGIIADALRPYGIKVYLSVNFASPAILGGLKNADPLDSNVQKWWADKVREIYKKITDFGGFLVKANSEGQPGPSDYNRSHADGANMLADIIKPYKGIIIWRSFVYGSNHKGEDRVKQAVSEFEKMDGQFRNNVILQSKNGPLDFQPREPYAPIFDNIKHTNQMAEFQITQEYTGQSIHLVYLAPMWAEFFHYVDYHGLCGVSGVANIGDDKNWCGHPFSQANWYAFGRLAWNPELSADAIAEEWLTQTFGNDSVCNSEIRNMMLSSREACVDYMMPLGLHHLFKFDHHYGPEPGGFRPDYPLEWCPAYYNKADSLGVGFDRTTKGSNAVSQYRHPYDSIYNSLQTCPEEYLLWFHHVPWTYKMKNGLSIADNLRMHYDSGVKKVEDYLVVWQKMFAYIDTQRWNMVNDLLKKQLENAREWHDVCLGYFDKKRKE